MKMSSLVVVALVLSVLPACCETVPCGTLPRLRRTNAERDKAASVVLTRDSKPTYFCGGVWVAEDRILTALHCVADLGRPKQEQRSTFSFDIFDDLGLDEPPSAPVEQWNPVGQTQSFEGPGDGTYYAVVLKIDRDNDLALLGSASRPAHDVAKVRWSQISDGEPVDIVGAPDGVPFSYARGYVAATRRANSTANEGERFKHLQVCAPVYFGNSGGGGFDEQGLLVGIADEIAVENGAQAGNISYFVHADTIREFLKTP